MPMQPANGAKLIGESDSFLEVIDHVSQLTRLNRPVLVVGERGTGKELIAERLHFLSDRWSKPLTKMNCATVSDALLESELFGHEAGAFTGAMKRHVGRFERSDGGTLFLDELATMSFKTQEKLLRFIEYGEFERLGGSTLLRADVRIVAATNEDLPALAEQKKFRHDLLDRLAFDVITLPPLRHRENDIMLLAEHFAIKMCKELGYPLFSGFTENAKHILLQHSWPGNIRELKNVVERSVYRHHDPELPIDDININPFKSPFQLNQAPEAALTPSQHPRSTPPADNGEAKSEVNSASGDFKEQIQNFEITLLKNALKNSKFNQRMAAKALGLSYHQLRGLLRKYSLVNAD